MEQIERSKTAAWEDRDQMRYTALHCTWSGDAAVGTAHDDDRGRGVRQVPHPQGVARRFDAPIASLFENSSTIRIRGRRRAYLTREQRTLHGSGASSSSPTAASPGRRCRTRPSASASI